MSDLLPIASAKRTAAALWTEVRALPVLSTLTAIAAVTASAAGLVACMWATYRGSGLAP